MVAGEIRTDGLPSAASVQSFEKKIGRVIENVGIEGRKQNGLRAIRAVLGIGERNGGDILHLACRQRVSRNFAAARSINNVGIQGIRCGVSVLDHADRMPVAKGNLAVVAAARNAHRAAILLPAADEVRKRIAGLDVIELGGGLVEPRAPGFAAIDGHKRTLVARQKNDARVIRIDPKILIIVTTGRATQAGPGLSAIRGLHGHNACGVDDVRILRVYLGNGQIASTYAQCRPSIGGDALPVLPSIL